MAAILPDDIRPVLDNGIPAIMVTCSAEGIPNVICMSGNRKGMDDHEGMKNCAEGLKAVVGHAEEKKVTVIMEGLNSKVDHKDYIPSAQFFMPS